MISRMPHGSLVKEQGLDPWLLVPQCSVGSPCQLEVWVETVYM